ncbi:MAG: protein kinase [Candidatus Aminicenantes bacterium]|nr:MAG: protein kinase [Candidatus Aminicenantes bacterium]
MSIECPNCNFGNPADTKFCGNCGIQLPPSEDVSITRTKTFDIPKEELTTGSTFAGRYRIIEELGKGGMGKVYKALDTEVNEKVALKLIKPEIASDKKVIERFRSELKFARKIRHKNVCQMYDLNKEEGAYYITMEYVSGGNLKSFIRRAKRLDVETAVSIAKDVCEGLAEAHRLGVVHRDLKPQNIMVDDEGNARIMDFGIARSLDAEGITAEGAMIGTPEYMSPEQVDGTEADPRSDIYSIGVILYEAVTGRVPFKGNTAFSIAMKHKSETPREPREINPHIPDALSRLILKCMEKDKGMRFQKAEDLLSDLNAVEQEIPTGERAYPKRELLLGLTWLQLKERKIIPILAVFIGGGLAILAFLNYIIIKNYNLPRKTLDITTVTIVCGLICTLIWLWFHGIEKRRRRIKIEFFLIPSVILIAALINLSLFLGIEQGENSLAVLPIKDLSPQKDQEIYCEGIHEDIIRIINRVIPDLKVIDDWSVKKYADTDKDVREIGKELNADYILSVSLMIEGGKIRVTAKLIDAKSGFVIEAYPPYYCDFDFSNYAEVQQKIALNIANQLKLPYQNEQIPELRKIVTAERRALEYYGTARDFEAIFRDTSEERFFEESVKKYQEAIKIDPNYALAYWGLGNVYESHFIRKGNKEEDLDLMEKNFRRAIEIDPGLAEAYLGLGWIYFYKFSYDDAYYYFKLARQKDPDNSSVNYQIGSFLKSMGLNRPAIAYYSKSLETNPLHIRCYELLAQCYSFIGDFDKAVERIKTALSIEPSGSLYLQNSRHLIMKKNFAEAELEMAKVKETTLLSSRIQLNRALLFAAKGERELALELMKDFHDSYRIEVTTIYSLLGLDDKAIECIERGIREALREQFSEYYSYSFLNSNPYYDSLKDDSRFLEILEKERYKYQERMSKYGDL